MKRRAMRQRPASDSRTAIELERQLALIRQTMPETLERLEMLQRGDITAEHARSVTASQLHAYLTRAQGWCVTELGDWHFVHMNTGSRVDTTRADAAHEAIRKIADAEQRGQLAVWVDLTREQGD